jgi:hypothetical protein
MGWSRHLTIVAMSRYLTRQSLLTSTRRTLNPQGQLLDHLLFHERRSEDLPFTVYMID